MKFGEFLVKTVEATSALNQQHRTGNDVEKPELKCIYDVRCFFKIYGLSQILFNFLKSNSITLELAQWESDGWYCRLNEPKGNIIDYEGYWIGYHNLLEQLIEKLKKQKQYCLQFLEGFSEILMSNRLAYCMCYDDICGRYQIAIMSGEPLAKVKKNLEVAGLQFECFVEIKEGGVYPQYRINIFANSLEEEKVKKLENSFAQNNYISSVGVSGAVFHSGSGTFFEGEPQGDEGVPQGDVKYSLGLSQRSAPGSAFNYGNR